MAALDIEPRGLNAALKRNAADLVELQRLIDGGGTDHGPRAARVEQLKNALLARLDILSSLVSRDDASGGAQGGSAAPRLVAKADVAAVFLPSDLTEPQQRLVYAQPAGGGHFPPAVLAARALAASVDASPVELGMRPPLLASYVTDASPGAVQLVQQVTPPALLPPPDRDVGADGRAAAAAPSVVSRMLAGEWAGVYGDASRRDAEQEAWRARQAAQHAKREHLNLMHQQRLRATEQAQRQMRGGGGGGGGGGVGQPTPQQLQQQHYQQQQQQMLYAQQQQQSAPQQWWLMQQAQAAQAGQVQGGGGAPGLSAVWGAAPGAPQPQQPTQFPGAPGARRVGGAAPSPPPPPQAQALGAGGGVWGM